MNPGWLQLRRNFVTITNSPALQYLRRELGELGRELVEYYVPSTERYCLGIWRNRLAGYVAELTSYDHPSNVERNLVSYVRYYLQNRQASDSKLAVRAQQSRDRELRRSLEDRARQAAEWRKHRERRKNIHRRGNPASQTGPALRPDTSEDRVLTL
jgi:hypothetical protein